MKNFNLFKKDYIIFFIIITLSGCIGRNSYNNNNNNNNNEVIKKRMVVYLIEVKKNNFLPLLDSIIELEKKCSYYNEHLYFFIQKDQSPFKNFIMISAQLILDPEYFHNKELGFFFYKKHLFLVENFDIGKPYLFSKVKKHEIYADKLDYDYFPDDRGSKWIIDYADDYFSVRKIYTYCK